MQQQSGSAFHAAEQAFTLSRGRLPLVYPSAFRYIQCVAFLIPLVFAIRSAVSAAGCSLSSCGFVPTSAPTSCPGFPIVLVQAIKRVRVAGDRAS